MNPCLCLDVTLRRREPDEILWRGQGLRLNDVYGGSRAAVVTTSSEFPKRHIELHRCSADDGRAID